MAEHHPLHLSSPESSPFLGLQLTSPSGFSRLSNDISLEEFEDEDFSEIVDDCGITAPCLSDMAGSPHAPILNLKQQVVGSLVEHLQEDLLELELIDAEDDEFETEEREQSSAKTSIHGVCHHVPQDTLNNNCGPKKSTWQDKVRSSSPLRNGFHSPSHLCLKEEQQKAAMAGDRQASSKLNSSSNHNGLTIGKYSGTGMENLAYGSLWRTEASHRAVSGREEPAVRGAPPGSADLVRETPPGSSRPAREDPPGMAESGLVAPLGRDEPDGETETARDASAPKDEEEEDDDDDDDDDDDEAGAEEDDDDEDGAVKEQSAEYFTVLQRKAREQPIFEEGQQQRPSCVGVLEEDPQWASLDGCKEVKSPGATPADVKSTEARGEPCAARQSAVAGGGYRPARSSDSSALSYESVRYMLVMDEHTKLEMSALSPPRIAGGTEEDGGAKRGGTTPVPPDVVSPRDAEAFRRHEVACFSDTTCSSPESEFPFSKKFLNVFMNGATRSSSTESFGLFSCVIDGEEREQTHRAVFRFVPRHPDEVPMDVDDPLYVERQADDFWCEGYNMRTGEHGVFPAYYAHAVSQDPEDIYGKSRNDDWVERFGLHFLGSVEVPYHKGNNVLCAAMQKIAQARRVTVHLKPPSVCTLEITAQGIRLVLKAGSYQGGKCSHFFKLRNVSFCGYHPKKSNYFGFITKHPSDHRFACHVFVAEDSTRPVAESVGKAFQVFYKEYLEYACPTEDIYLE